MFVRWLGAFRECLSPAASALWEVSQEGVEVAAEPLFHGRSRLIGNNKAFVGLVACEETSIFRAGFLRDCYSQNTQSGRLHATDKTQKVFKDKNRFLSVWSKKAPRHHGEVFFAKFTAKAVAVDANATARQLRIAKDIAASLNIGLVKVETYNIDWVKVKVADMI
jgi:hypothetical protein